jgi:hypothetical protein
MKLAALLLVITVLVAGCTSTGQTTQPIKEKEVIQPVAEQTEIPAAQPATNKCTDNTECPSGMSCLKNICVKVQFVK